MGPICGRQDPGGLHVGPMNLAIWEPNGSFVIGGFVIYICSMYQIAPECSVVQMEDIV